MRKYWICAIKMFSKKREEVVEECAEMLIVLITAAMTIDACVDPLLPI